MYVETTFGPGEQTQATRVFAVEVIDNRVVVTEHNPDIPPDYVGPVNFVRKDIDEPLRLDDQAEMPFGSSPIYPREDFFLN